jgi:hypothetical protein
LPLLIGAIVHDLFLECRLVNDIFAHSTSRHTPQVSTQPPSARELSFAEFPAPVANFR